MQLSSKLVWDLMVKLEESVNIANGNGNTNNEIEISISFVEIA